MNYWFYIELAVILTLIEWLLVRLGKRYRLGPEVSERSSHTRFTPTGGGLVWVLASITAIALYGDLTSSSTWLFMGGIVCLAVISAIDDLHPLPPVPRLISQIIIIALTFKQLCYPQAFDVYIIVLFCGVGLINALNFLDGICGMLALYGIVVTTSILVTLLDINNPGMNWLVPVIVAVLIAQVIFAMFNLTDVIFGGDIGSITLGYIQVVALFTIILITRDGSYIIFFAVCIADTGLTTLHRLFKGVSILKPHRQNIYQTLTGPMRMSQRAISAAYAGIQLVISAGYLLLKPKMHWTYFILVAAILIVAYFTTRYRIRNFDEIQRSY